MNKCSFCGKPESQVQLLITGLHGYICNECVQRCEELLQEVGLDKASASGKGSHKYNLKEVPKPTEIKAYLDQYIIGQDDAKRYLAVSVYNHYKRLRQPHDDSGVEIEKSNIIMVGSTGTGKTLLARTIAKLLDVPFTIVDATVFTEAGYVGEDVESILSRLLQVADYDIKAAEQGIVFIDEIDKIAQRMNAHTVGFNSVQNTAKIDKGDLMQYVLPQDLKSFGLIPEIIGRLPVLTYLKPLDKEALRRILVEPKNSIIKQYEKLFSMDGIKLSFPEETLDYIVAKAMDYKLGARGLRSIVETVMMDAMYEIPSKKVKTFKVTLNYAKEQLEKSSLNRMETAS